MKIYHLLIVQLFLLVFCASCQQKQPDKSAIVEKSQSFVPDGSDPIAIRPQIVRVHKVEIDKGGTVVEVGNINGSYSLVCNTGVESCITPVAGADYFLFTKETRWKFSGAKEYATLKFFQDWSISYNNQENIALALVSRNAKGEWELSGTWGIYWLRSWEGKQ